MHALSWECEEGGRWSRWTQQRQEEEERLFLNRLRSWSLVELRFEGLKAAATCVVAEDDVALLLQLRLGIHFRHILSQAAKHQQEGFDQNSHEMSKQESVSVWAELRDRGRESIGIDSVSICGASGH